MMVTASGTWADWAYWSVATPRPMPECGAPSQYSFTAASMDSGSHQHTSPVFSSVHSSQFSHTARKAVRLFLPFTSNSPSSTGSTSSRCG